MWRSMECIRPATSPTAYALDPLTPAPPFLSPPAEMPLSLGQVRGLSKRLGQKHADEMVDLLTEVPPRLSEVASRLLINYYDDMYNYQATKRPNFGHSVECDGGDALENAKRLLKAYDEHYS